MARETCAHCGRELWHASGGWRHLFTISVRCDGERGQGDEALVATPVRRVYWVRQKKVQTAAMKEEPGCESAEAPT